MHITKKDSKRFDWDHVKSFNYKLPHLTPPMSVIYAEINGEHGEVTTKESEWVYFVIEGNGVFYIDGKETNVSQGDVLTIPSKTKYNYRSINHKPLKVVMFIDIWAN